MGTGSWNAVRLCRPLFLPTNTDIKSALQDESIFDLCRNFTMKIVLAGVEPIILRPTPAWIACSTVCGAAYPSS